MDKQTPAPTPKPVVYPNDTHYSKNFTRKELNCGCGCETPAHIEKELLALANELEILRAEAGGTSLHVTCAYRCEKRNAAVGGAKASEHMKGRAADVYHGKLTIKQLAGVAYVKVPAFRKGSTIQYPKSRFLHVDKGVGPHRPFHDMDGEN